LAEILCFAEDLKRRLYVLLKLRFIMAGAAGSQRSILCQIEVCVAELERHLTFSGRFLQALAEDVSVVVQDVAPGVIEADQPGLLNLLQIAVCVDNNRANGLPDLLPEFPRRATELLLISSEACGLEQDLVLP
jgi:hypothetical protein